MTDEQQIDVLMEAIYDTRFQMSLTAAKARQRKAKAEFYMLGRADDPGQREVQPEDFDPLPVEATKVYVSHYALGLLKTFAYQRPAIHVDFGSKPVKITVFGLAVFEDETRDRAEAGVDFDKISME